jgi:ribosomal protein S12 methylthiotransferase
VTETKLFNLSSLGCPKNRVDSERILSVMMAAGFGHVDEPESASVIVVNTCAFIEAAATESINAILDLRERNPDAVIVAAGCLPLRYGAAAADPLPEVDVWVAPIDIPDMPRLIAAAAAQPSVAAKPRLNAKQAGPRRENGPGDAPNETYPRPTSPVHHSQLRPSPEDPGNKIAAAGQERILTTSGYAYLRIAEGCSKACRYCTIPSIRGRLISVPAEALEDEARSLADRGVRELVLVAQDLTAYGSDRKEKGALVNLLKRITRIGGIKWIRLMYLHPSGVPRELPAFINESEKILPYLDIPLQHVSDTVLRAMGRPGGGDRIRSLLDRLRKEIDGLALRTTLMVGFPGEGEGEFEELKQFVTAYQIEHVGVFEYSPEEGTPAYGLGDPVPKKVKRSRAAQIRRIHTRFAARRNQKRIGTIEECLVEGFSEETELLLHARTWDQAPEVDGTLYITDGTAVAGEIHSARITGRRDSDLFGELIYQR